MLIQLSGVPGSGKSTLARAISARRGAVVLDTDVLKSALLVEGIALADAGRATYAGTVALAADLLEQGHEVVMDSPCRYRELLAATTGAALAAGVPFAFIELRTDDVGLLLSRLDRRLARRSQVASGTEPAAGTDWEFGTAEATLTTWQQQLVRPEHGALTLDAALDPAQQLRLVEEYLERAGRPPGGD